MKRAFLIRLLLVALILLVVACEEDDYHGVRFNFHIAPGQVVGITPKGGDRTFTLSRQEEEDPPFITLISGVEYDITLWYPGIEPTYMGTMVVRGKGVEGSRDIWLPLHNAEPGVFDWGWVYGGID